MLYQIFQKKSEYDSDSSAKMVARYGDDRLYTKGEIITLNSNKGPVKLKIVKIEEDHDLTRVFKEEFYHVYVLKL